MGRPCSSIENKKHAYNLLVKTTKGNRQLGRPRHTWIDNIEMDLGDTGWNSMDWIARAQDMDHEFL
jgi:hypothetical protein